MLKSSKMSSAKASTPYRQIRAVYDEDFITVYQAYPAAIAEPAVEQQRLDASPAFLTTRMTWIKPSWCWMMYRSGYSRKDKGQERILALRMRHEHFLALLECARVSDGHHRVDQRDRRGEEANSGGEEEGKQEQDHQAKSELNMKRNPSVVVQWDPERGPRLQRLDYRSIQIGIPRGLSSEWVKHWIVDITDVTQRALDLAEFVRANPKVCTAEVQEAGLMPLEQVYAVSQPLKQNLQLDVAG